MIGGFLGAGKTTTISRLAAHYRDQGHRVVIVTNDQATDLVDTLLLRKQGFDVGEVAGSCFCCNFDALTDTVSSLSAEERPDIIIAEPVGSCTDLVATVIRPLEQVYAVKFDIAPYGVILKPNHGLRILSGDKKGGFSPQAEYIFRKQIEEADFVIINRIDEVSSLDRKRLIGMLEGEFPGRPVILTSAIRGDGFQDLLNTLDSDLEVGARQMDVDYDVYAIGEAELGWLNAQFEVTSEMEWDLDDLLVEVVSRIGTRVEKRDAETAHLKAIGMEDGYYAVANLTSRGEKPKLSLASEGVVRQANIVVNARVAIDPEDLTELVRLVFEEVASEQNATAMELSLQSFKPGRPVPTHRIAQS